MKGLPWRRGPAAPDYPAYPEDERSERARDVGFRGRWRGGRLMLVAHGPLPHLAVIELRKIRGGGEAPGYIGDALSGQAMMVGDADIVVPDPGPVQAALRAEATNPGPGLLPQTIAALVGGYIWMSWNCPQEEADRVATAVARDPGLAPAVAADEALGAWSSRDLCWAAADGRAVVRVPFIAACRTAAGHALIIDSGSPWQLGLDPRTVAFHAAPLGPPPITAEEAGF